MVSLDEASSRPRYVDLRLQWAFWGERFFAKRLIMERMSHMSFNVGIGDEVSAVVKAVGAELYRWEAGSDRGIIAIGDGCRRQQRN